jgi:hypothetical protein
VATTALSFKSPRVLGFLAVVLHSLLFAYCYLAPSEGSFGLFPVFIVDFPASLLALAISRVGIGDAIALAVVGAIWWYCLVAGIATLLHKHRALPSQ